MKTKIILQLIIPPAVLILCLILFIWLLSIPTISKGIKTRSEIIDATSQLQEATNRQEALRKAKKYEKQIFTTSDSVYALWPDATEVSNFLILMEELANQKQIKINNIAVEEGATPSSKPKSAPVEDAAKSTVDAAETPKQKAAKKPAGIEFSFDTTSSFPTIIELLASLEELKRFNTISTLVLDGNSLGSVITLRVTGYIYAN